MVTLPHFSGSEGQRPWPTSHHPSRRGRLRDRGRSQGCFPLLHSRRGVWVTMTTLLHFSRSEGQRPWPPSHLPPRREGQWGRGRDHGSLPSCFSEEGWGCAHGHTLPLSKEGRAEVMATFPVFFWTWYEDVHVHFPPFLTSREARGWMRGDHGHTPSLLKIGRATAMANLPSFL